MNAITADEVYKGADDPIDLSAIAQESAVLLYAKLCLVRAFEERVTSMFLQGKIPGTIHLALGQEACAVGACAALNLDDWITITHRGHGQALAKGVDPGSLMAELFAKDGGCCRGYGGSLHVGDISVGALPAIAIVGASIPIAAGIAYAFKTRREPRVALCFTGDGAMGEGDSHEGLNLAALWQVPVLYLCENNLYSISTPVSRQFRNTRLAERAESYGMKTTVVDGNNVVAVYEAVRSAVAQIRSGAGPMFVECLTYRRGGHKRDDPGTYRPRDEVDRWLERDPLQRMRRALVAIGLDERAAQAERQASEDIDKAVAFAEASPLAGLELL
jgi:acetoin:2,6-dichlorophenolindophenol oxidoreductase subunit alpha